MCDFFLEKMEKDQGDLTDIIGGGGNTTGTSSSDLLLPSDATTFAPSSSSDFGNPFPNFQDPILNDFFNILSPSGEGGSMGLNMDQKFVSTYEDQDMRNNKPCSMLPRTGTVQMPVSAGGAKPSPLSPRAICPYPMMAMDGGRGSLQISSPRTTGMKRRKNQAKKVICIPAPAVPTGGRPTGEVVPSDLWAWRKYGQKPIKGSPYPRGYYRCSSSKGCSARKQVERSRTDPNMLVITYTSEHNHPWPTQRNALAGSTRSQHAKNNCSSSTKSSQNRNVQLEEPNNQRVPKQEPNKEIIATKTSTTTTTNYIVKEDHEEMGNRDKCIIDQLQDNEFDQELLMDQYKPMIPESGSGQPDDFFGDLQELEDDPMNLIFTKEYMEAKPSNVDEKRGDKASSDIFSLLEWG